MQIGDEPRFAMGEIAPQQVAKQVVVAIPVALLVERDEEQVGAVRLSEQRGTVAGARERVAQRRAHTLEDRRAHEELAHRPRGILDHLVQVVADLAVVPRERADERSPVLAPAQRQRGELQPGRPALGPLPQQPDVRGGKLERQRSVQQRSRRDVVEAQFLRAHLDALVGGERQRRIGTTREHQLQRGRQVREQERDRRVHDLVADQVVVVEHQHDRLRQLRQLVDQPRQHDLGDAGAGVGEHRQRRAAEPGRDRPQRGDHVAPESDRIVVGGIERDPRERPPLDRVPLGEQHRLPPARRCAHQRQPAVGAAREPRDQLAPGHEPGANARNVQLRLDEDEPSRSGSGVQRALLMRGS